MSGPVIKPMTPEDLSEVSRFVWRSVDALRQQDGFHPRTSAPHELERERWLLGRMSGNPFHKPEFPIGWTLRQESGTVVGVLLAFAWNYRLGDRLLQGLTAGPFFVDPSARLHGFFMFRQYLNTRSVDFWYANTCNANAGAIWRKLGGVAVPDSDMEYLLVFRAGPVLEEAMLRRRPAGFATRFARLAGAFAFPLVWRGRSPLAIQETSDWERMAAIAEKHRNPKLLTCDRSVPYLRWTYEEALTRKTVEVHRFEDGRGEEGWFSLSRAPRGRIDQIRGVQLLDVVWPRQRMDFQTVLPAIAKAARRDGDLLSIRPRPGITLTPRHLAVIRRKLPAPEAFVLTRSAADPDLNERADLSAVDAI